MRLRLLQAILSLKLGISFLAGASEFEIHSIDCSDWMETVVRIPRNKKNFQWREIPGSSKDWSPDLRVKVESLLGRAHDLVPVGEHAHVWTEKIAGVQIAFLRADSVGELGHILIRPSQLFESPNPAFRWAANQAFNRRDLRSWYEESKNISGRFWNSFVGYNIPHQAFRSLDSGNFNFLSFEEIQLIQKLKELKLWDSEFFLVGFTPHVTEVDSTEVFLHELAHSLFWGNPAYREEIKDLLKKLPSSLEKKMDRFLTHSGYAQDVFEDETHAWLLAGPNFSLKITRNEKSKILKMRKKLLKILEKFL